MSRYVTIKTRRTMEEPLVPIPYDERVLLRIMRAHAVERAYTYAALFFAQVTLWGCVATLMDICFQTPIDVVDVLIAIGAVIVMYALTICVWNHCDKRRHEAVQDVEACVFVVQQL